MKRLNIWPIVSGAKSVSFGFFQYFSHLSQSTFKDGKEKLTKRVLPKDELAANTQHQLIIRQQEKMKPIHFLVAFFRSISTELIVNPIRRGTEDEVVGFERSDGVPCLYRSATVVDMMAVIRSRGPIPLRQKRWRLLFPFQFSFRSLFYIYINYHS